MKGTRHQIHEVTWVRGNEKFTLKAERDNPIYAPDIEEYRSQMIGDADNLYLTYTTYES